jgi:hypothetical protein
MSSTSTDLATVDCQISDLKKKLEDLQVERSKLTDILKKEHNAMKRKCMVLFKNIQIKFPCFSNYVVEKSCSSKYDCESVKDTYTYNKSKRDTCSECDGARFEMLHSLITGKLFGKEWILKDHQLSHNYSESTVECLVEYENEEVVKEVFECIKQNKSESYTIVYNNEYYDNVEPKKQIIKCPEVHEPDCTLSEYRNWFTRIEKMYSKPQESIAKFVKYVECFDDDDNRVRCVICKHGSKYVDNNNCINICCSKNTPECYKSLCEIAFKEFQIKLPTYNECVSNC